MTDDSAWRPPAAAPAPAEQLAGYADLVEVGRGGDSVVYRARDLALGRAVAVKVLQVDDAPRVERFVREIEITVELGRQHPNIVKVLAIGTTESGKPAIVMDFYERGSLHDQLKSRGPLAVHEVVGAGTVVADALTFAHQQGVLHRDVKPQNVLVLPTSWVLADFGIARLVDTEHTASAETFTYRHASPQLLDGMPPTEADDIWALGSTLFTLLDGRAPFSSDDADDDSALAYLRRVRTEPHRRPRVTDAGGDPTALMELVDRCLAKELDQRWQSAAELRDALASIRVHGWEPGAAALDAPVVTPTGHTGETGGTPGRHSATPTPTPTSTPATPAPTAVRPGAPATSVQTGVAAEATPTPTPQLAPEPPAPVEEPQPVALSALAHRAMDPDGDPTGTRPPEALTAPAALPGAEPPAQGRPPVDPARRRRRRLFIGLAALALVVGLGLSVVGAALRHGNDAVPETRPTAGTGAEPVPSLTAAPSQSGDPQPQVPNDDLSFAFLGLSSNGATISLNWQDPSKGEGQFVLSETYPDKNFVTTFDPGTTEATIPFPIADGQRTCFTLVVAMPTGEIGVSAGRPRCVNSAAPKG